MAPTHGTLFFSWAMPRAKVNQYTIHHVHHRRGKVGQSAGVKAHTKSHQRHAYIQPTETKIMPLFASWSQSSAIHVASALSLPKRTAVPSLLVMVVWLVVVAVTMGGLCCCPTWATVLLSTFVQVDDSALRDHHQHHHHHHHHWPTMAGLDNKSHPPDQRHSVYVPGKQQQQQQQQQQQRTHVSTDAH
jgi:hypothetical protein